MILEVQEQFLRGLVEEAGATWVGLRRGHRAGDAVLFKDGPEEATISLFVFALRKKSDVQMALKAYRDEKNLVKIAGMR